MYSQSLGFFAGKYFIAYYGLFIVIGILAAALLGWLQIRRYHLNFDMLILIAAVSGLLAIIGAKVLFFIVSRDQIQWDRIGDTEYLNALLAGGFVFYGGLIGCLIGFLICRYCFKVDVILYLNKALPCLPLAHGFGQLGCSRVGCCYGIPYSGPFAITYHDSIFAPNDVPLFPVQAAEAVMEFLIAAFLLVYINRFSGKHCLKWYLCLYAVTRFLLEFLRYDDTQRGMMFGISTSQYISLLLIAAVAVHSLLLQFQRAA